MLEKLYWNPGRQIKIVALIMLIAGAIASLAWAVYLAAFPYVYDLWSFLDVIGVGFVLKIPFDGWRFARWFIGGLVATYVSVLFVYAFGDLVQRVCSTSARKTIEAA